MIGVYIITNTINQKCYVGQSKNITRRWTQHKQASKSQNDDNYNYPLYQAFRKYGIDCFVFEILEECSIDELNEREEYWIDSLNPDYNQLNVVKIQRDMEKLSDEDKNIIINRLKNNQFITFFKLAQEFGVSRAVISSINIGTLYKIEGETYPLCLNNASIKLTKEEVLKIKAMLRGSEIINFKTIGEMFNVSVGAIRNINTGKTYQEDSETYPISFRVGREKIKYEQVQLIQNKLQEKDFMDLKELAKEFNVSLNIIQDINKGNTWVDKNYEYPLSKQEKYFLTEEIAEEIQQRLINNDFVSMNKLAIEYKVHKDTIGNLNIGACHYNSKLSYPLFKRKENTTGNGKLTEAEVQLIRQELKEGLFGSYKTIGDKYGVKAETIGLINRGKSWKDASEIYPLINMKQHRKICKKETKDELS